MHVLALKGTLTSWHDGGAALLRDGLPLCAVANERITGKKYDGGAEEAAAYCLAHAGLKPVEVEHLVEIGPKPQRWVAMSDRVHWRLRAIHWGERYFAMRHGIIHHHAHMASAFYPSGFDRAAILSVDGMGDIYTTLAGIGEGTRIRTIQGTYFPHSLGMFYDAFTQFCGFGELEAGKLMGLAPYGEKSEYYHRIRPLIRLKTGRHGLFWLDRSYFCPGRPGYTSRMVTLLGQPRRDEEPTCAKFANIAWGCQRVTEEALIHSAQWLYERTRCKNLCLAGGVGLNSVANKRLVEETPFENVFVQPASSDTGCALGAALYYQHQILGMERRYHMRHAYLGREYSQAEIEAAIPQREDVAVEKPKDLTATVARLLADQYIVGWFQGGSEIGPRALGHRSILCDPRRGQMKQILNDRVKHREMFRPFAPSVLAEKAHDYFEIDVASPFMLLVAPIRPDKRSVIPAVVHVDGTGRVQTVTREANGTYYDVIDAFGKLTGVPVILNTSFNIAGKPIVETPEDAVNCWLGTAIDCLVLGDRLLRKRVMPTGR